MADPDAAQLAILRHALGLNQDGTGRAYRNHFVTGPGCDEYLDCTALVDAGLMTRHDGSPLSGGEPIFIVTRDGKTKSVAPAVPESSGETSP